MRVGMSLVDDSYFIFFNLFMQTKTVKLEDYNDDVEDFKRTNFFQLLTN